MTLTKTLTFSPEVQEIIREKFEIVPGEGGQFLGHLAPVNRKQYEKVIKAIEVAGGVWNRKAKAHIFNSDPREALGLIVAQGKATVARDGFYPTPNPLVEQMLTLAFLQRRMRVLEPSAGDGAIAKLVAAKVSPLNLVLVEKDPGRAKALREQGYRLVYERDFLLMTPAELGQFDRVYMNPPFELFQDIDHIMHAYSFLLPGGMLVGIMGESAFFRSENKALDFRAWLREVGGQDRRLPEGAFKASGSNVQARMVLIKR